MDWRAQGGKDSVYPQCRDSIVCAKLSPLDVVPRCPTTVCLKSGLDKPFLEAEGPYSALGLPAENCYQQS